MKTGTVFTCSAAHFFAVEKVAGVFFFLQTACTTHPPSRATYYVAKNGSDDNPGTEAESWLTIQKAASTVCAGDSVVIKAGIYSERVVPESSGGERRHITYAAFFGDSVTIDGSGITLPAGGGLFDLSGRRSITVSGLRVVHAGPESNNAGIRADGSSHIVIENNYTGNTMSSGIGVWGSDNIIVDENGVELACKDGMQEFISVGGTSYFEVKNNHVHNGTPAYVKEGICIKDGSNNGLVYGNHVHDVERVGIYIDAWDKHTYNIDVFENVIHDIADNNGISQASGMGGFLENVKIYGNVAYHNRYCGIVISTHGPGSALGQRPMKHIRAINNTFYNNGWTVWGGGINIENPFAEDVVVRNNICSQNLYFQLAVDAGSSIDAPVDDFDGNQRPHGSGFDIGAFECMKTMVYESSPAQPVLLQVSAQNGDSVEQFGPEE